MTDYISREDLLSRIRRLPYPDGIISNIVATGIFIPAADVVPRESGRWANGVCRDCGKRPDELRRGTELEYSYWEKMPPYCPNCGRKMNLEVWTNG